MADQKKHDKDIDPTNPPNQTGKDNISRKKNVKVEPEKQPAKPVEKGKK